MSSEQPGESYARSWAKLRRLRYLCIGMFVGYVPVMALFAMVSDKLYRSYNLAFGLALSWMFEWALLVGYIQAGGVQDAQSHSLNAPGYQAVECGSSREGAFIAACRAMRAGHQSSGWPIDVD